MTCYSNMTNLIHNILTNNNYHHNDRSKSYLCVPKKITLTKRFMMTRILKKVPNISLPEKEEIGKSSLKLCEMLTKENIIEDLSTTGSSLKNVTPEFYNFVSNNTYGTSSVKTNLLACVAPTLKFPFDNLIPKIASPKIVLPPNNTLFPVRSFNEIITAENFAARSTENIKKITLTGDKISVSSNSNPNPDYLITFFSEAFSDSIRYYDAKSGTLDNDWFKGHIKQIYINENNQPFSYPHKPVILKETLGFYKDTLARLNAKNFQDICQQKMTKKEFDYYQYQNNEAQALLQNVTQFVDIPHLENVLLKIQSIPTFPKAITFANVYQIKNCNLTENELKFMQKLMPYINPDMFASQRALEKHMRTALNLYNEYIDKNTLKKMKPLRITYNWLKTEFDNISDDIFIF